MAYKVWQMLDRGVATISNASCHGNIYNWILRYLSASKKFFLLFQEHVFLTFFQLDADNFEKEGKLAEIQAQRGYTYSDCITCTPEKLPNYEQKVLSVCNEVTFLT